MKTDPRGVRVADHFIGKSASVADTYAKILEAVARFGRVREEPKKTSIHLVRESALAGVQVRRDSLIRNVKTDYPIESPRVLISETLSAHRFHTQFRLSSPRDVDSEIGRWLKDAWEISGGKA
jgi:hypothetical protein